MTIEEKIAELEAENARMRGTAYHPSPPAERNLCSAEWLAKVKPGFKAFCRPQLGERTLTLAEILARKSKAANATIKAAMKPKGIWSILKENPYTTGRLVHCGDGEYPETLKIYRLNANEWLSTEPEPEITVVPQKVPDFGKYLPEPVVDDDEAAPNPAQDEQNDDFEGGVVERLVQALEEQNRLLMASLARRRAA